MSETYQTVDLEEKPKKIALDSRIQPGQVFLPAMANRYWFERDGHDLGQSLDGLTVRAEPWRRIGKHLHEGCMPDGEHFMIGKCGDQEVADGIAVPYMTAIKNIQSQMEVRP